MTLLKILQILYYHVTEYDFEKAMKKIERDLGKLQYRIMTGDKEAARLAWVTLEQYDRMKIEFEARHFYYEEVMQMVATSVVIYNQIKTKN